VDANETSFLMDTAPVVGAEKLLRHAQIATTMNVYGSAMMESKREANSNVVQMVHRQELRKAK